MDQRLSVVTLGVADLARARAFYEQGLGWAPSGLVNDQVCFYQLGGIALALYGRAALAADARTQDSGAAFSGLVLAHNVRSADEVGQVLQQAAAAGGRILKEPTEEFWGGVSGYFSDPDGHPWEVAWNPHFPMDEAGALSLPAADA